MAPDARDRIERAIELIGDVKSLITDAKTSNQDLIILAKLSEMEDLVMESGFLSRTMTSMLQNFIAPMRGIEAIAKTMTDIKTILDKYFRYAVIIAAIATALAFIAVGGGPVAAEVVSLWKQAKG